MEIILAVSSAALELQCQPCRVLRGLHMQMQLVRDKLQVSCLRLDCAKLSTKYYVNYVNIFCFQMHETGNLPEIWLKNNNKLC